MRSHNGLTRREMLAAAAAIVAGGCMHAAQPPKEQKLAHPAPTTQPTTMQANAPATGPVWDGPIIDIHQHTNYHGRSDQALLHHQKKMGVTQTILLPSGSPIDSASTLKGKANGLYAGAGGIETVVPIAKAHPGEYYFCANEVPDLPQVRSTIEAGLKRGAIGIGEQKFNLPCDSLEMQAIYEIAQEYKVPVIMHFQYETFNTGFENLGKMLKKWPGVVFVGHALMFWANIDKVVDPKVGYPKGKVTPGGLTDRYMSDYPNLYADMSAFSGLNAFTRDPDHAHGFIERHQDRMLFGSDCADAAGVGPGCTGHSMIAAIQRLAPSKEVARKLLYGNAKGLFKI